ncbi:MAG: DUF3995 domain-containing protein [Flavobacterium sp.]|nr:MAG: DUF3995 domain-containing protein [Flavobacterium sp.]
MQISTFIVFLLFFIFTFLSSIHVYWAFGGKWASETVLPSKNDNVPLFRPRIVSTFIVAFGLFCFGLFYLIKFGFVLLNLPLWINQYGLWIITFIFLVRAIGDFKYVGLFRKFKKTTFGINDKKYFTPLCLFIVILTLILEFIN